MSQITPGTRRGFLRWLAAAAGALGASRTAQAQDRDADLFGEPSHKVVYQFNKADEDYMQHVLFSVGELLRKYGDDIRLVVTAIGPGIHILAKRPERPVPKMLRQRVESLAQYGVAFHACGNTMNTLGWSKEDLLDFAEVVDVGADDLMRLQEQGYAYISW
jgi:intracellular sulfur oxidation DsrE/DsrF family protein